MKISSKDSIIEEQPFVTLEVDNFNNKRIVELDCAVTKDVLIVHDSTNTLVSDKRFIQASKVEALSMEEQVPLLSSFE